MTQGYERGLTAAKVDTNTKNPYPTWCREYDRFEAALDGKPDPDQPSQPLLPL